jgi:ribosomal protein S1
MSEDNASFAELFQESESKPIRRLKPGQKITATIVGISGESVFRKRGFEAPRNLVIDPFDGSGVIADTYNVRLVKLSSKGKELGVWETDSAPWWVSLEE